jgi:hypothetical protein
MPASSAVLNFILTKSNRSNGKLQTMYTEDSFLSWTWEVPKSKLTAKGEVEIALGIRFLHSNLKSLKKTDPSGLTTQKQLSPLKISRGWAGTQVDMQAPRSKFIGIPLKASQDWGSENVDM